MESSARTHLDHFPYLLTWIASVATALLCAIVTAAFMAWMPVPIANPEDGATPAESPPMPAQPASATPDKALCAECGVIESLRQIDARGDEAAESTRNYEFTVRLGDGSRRVYTESTPRTWRSGARVKVVD
jgi:hypothetical protein